MNTHAHTLSCFLSLFVSARASQGKDGGGVKALLKNVNPITPLDLTQVFFFKSNTHVLEIDRYHAALEKKTTMPGFLCLDCAIKLFLDEAGMVKGLLS